jgi:outer membrane lipoprotein-sorting protein
MISHLSPPRPGRRWGLPSLCALLLCLLAACAAPPLRPAIEAPAPAEGLIDQLLQRLQHQAEAYRAIEGLARVRISSQGQTYNATQVVLAEQPDHLRAETLSPFGTALLVLATDGERVGALLPGEGVFYQGEASARNLQRFTRLPLRLEDLLDLLLYRVPLIEAQHMRLTRDQGGNLLLIREGEDGARQELTFDGAHMLTASAYLYGEELQLRVRYQNFSGDGTGYPTSLQLEMPPAQTEAALEFSEVRLNGSIPPQRFQLSAPAGVEVRELAAE